MVRPPRTCPKFYPFPPKESSHPAVKGAHSQPSAFQSPKASTAQENKQMKEWLDPPPRPTPAEEGVLNWGCGGGGEQLGRKREAWECPLIQKRARELGPGTVPLIFTQSLSSLHPSFIQGEPLRQARVCGAGCSLSGGRTSGRMNHTHAQADAAWLHTTGHRECRAPRGASVGPSSASPSCTVPGTLSSSLPRVCTPVRQTSPSTPLSWTSMSLQRCGGGAPSSHLLHQLLPGGSE